MTNTYILITTPWQALLHDMSTTTMMHDDAVMDAFLGLCIGLADCGGGASTQNLTTFACEHRSAAGRVRTGTAAAKLTIDAYGRGLRVWR